MEWFSQNWIWVLFFFVMIAMHLFGHGGHGGHGSGYDESTPAGKDDLQPPLEKVSIHKH